MSAKLRKLVSPCVGLVVAIALALPAQADAKSRARKSAKATPTQRVKAPSAPRVKATSRHKVKSVVVRKPAVRVEAARPSFGSLAALPDSTDPLDLKSRVALVMDQETNEVLLAKNTEAVLPIASITKLMTALVVLEARQPMDEVLEITAEDIDTEKHSSSRLAPGTRLTRGEMLHLALMSSENRAANALGRHYPGGLGAAITAMNAKARALGMKDTRYVEPTGLSSSNQSSAHDLALLVKTAYQYDTIRELSTSLEHQVAVGRRQLQFRTTNALVRSPMWDIGLQKTGYISEAGRCMVVQASLAGRKLIVVLLDSAGKYSRVGDAERIRKWLTQQGAASAGATSAGAGAPKLTS